MATKAQIRAYMKEHGCSREEAKQHFNPTLKLIEIPIDADAGKDSGMVNEAVVWLEYNKIPFDLYIGTVNNALFKLDSHQEEFKKFTGGSDYIGDLKVFTNEEALCLYAGSVMKHDPMVREAILKLGRKHQTKEQYDYDHLMRYRAFADLGVDEYTIAGSHYYFDSTFKYIINLMKIALIKQVDVHKSHDDIFGMVKGGQVIIHINGNTYTMRMRVIGVNKIRVAGQDAVAFHNACIESELFPVKLSPSFTHDPNVMVYDLDNNKEYLWDKKQDREVVSTEATEDGKTISGLQKIIPVKGHWRNYEDHSTWIDSYMKRKPLPHKYYLRPEKEVVEPSNINLDEDVTLTSYRLEKVTTINPDTMAILSSAFDGLETIIWEQDNA